MVTELYIRVVEVGEGEGIYISVVVFLVLMLGKKLERE